MGQRKKVLIVDDAIDIRQVGELLLQHDFEVIGTASDGSEALDAVRAEKPDLVVLDYGMPGLDGEDVGTWIKAVSPESKVLIFSGLPEAQKRFSSEWADAFLGKTDIVRLPEVAHELVAEV